MENGKWDYKTILVVLAVGIVFIGWQKYLEHKYPEYYKAQKAPQQASENNSEPLSAKGSQNLADGKSGSDTKTQDLQSNDTKLITLSGQKLIIETRQWKAELNSIGMSLENVIDKVYRDRKGEPVSYTGLGYLFQILDKKNQNPLVFQLNQSAEAISGEGVFSDGTIVRRVFRVNPEGFIDVETKVENVSPDFAGWVVRSRIPILETSSSLLSPSQDQTNFSISEDRVHFEHHRVGEDWAKEWSVVGAYSLSTHYFASVFFDKGNLLPKLISKAADKFLLVDAEYAVPAIGSGMQQSLAQRIYLGPKLASQIEKIDPSFLGVIDFGFFSSIGGVLLKLLKKFHEWTGNWGWAILVLTLFVRVLVLPFNIISYRSMKKMQLIQPKLQALRERYKDDPVAMNRETMELMKKEKVNPLGGCLPMLLQMPVFFALYQVLSHAIELYQAPFILWIHDLSAKDPYYVLPALMGVTLWVQHKLTPTTLDPAQAKIMGFMPILFTLFTLGLPSGLTFYIFVSTLFGVIQQKLFMNTNLKPSA